MADYGHELVFGTFVTPTAEVPLRAVALAQLTEQVGLDLVTLQDHPYQARFLDSWTLLSVIAAQTTTLRVALNVANLPLRPPAVLAKSVASLDLLTEGRVELGLGAGGFWDAIAAYGGRRLGPPQAVDALEEAIQVIRAIWAPSGSARIDGEYYRVHGAHAGPAPAHDVGIWLGSYKKRMLALTGRAADGWLPSSPYAGPDELPELNATIDAGAEAAGRDPKAIRRLYNIAGRFSSGGSGFLDGPAEVWAEQLAELTLEQGMSGYVLTADDPDAVRRFAGEVAPAVRELVAAGRASAAAASTSSPGRESLTAGGLPPRSDAESEEPTGPAGHPTAPNLGLVPTPDDGRRLSDVRLWDETTRPAGPAPDPRRAYTRAQRAAGQHLIDVHDHLRTELAQVRDLIEQVAAGLTDPGAVRSAINEMTLRQNNWTLGTYCESYCRVVTTHHTLEDMSVFPALRRNEPGLVPVLDRLEAEHEVIHEVLERVDRALVALVGGAKSVDELRAEVELLSDTLLSHLSYEERELTEPLARHGFS